MADTKQHDSPVEGGGEPQAYRDGYVRTLREFAWAREHGFTPSERRLVLALTQVTKIYQTVRAGKSIGGRDPEWLRGRADALRELLTRGAGASLPERDR